MRATRLHPLAEDYLIRLEAAAAALPTATAPSSSPAPQPSRVRPA